MLDAFLSSVDDAPYVNDLEPPAFTLAPELKALREQLGSYGFKNVMMSGSGSTIFCIGDPSEEARDTWQEEIVSKYKAEIFEQRFCARPADVKSWYA